MRHSSICIAAFVAALFLTANTVSAQYPTDGTWFRHLSAGVSAGTDGVGVVVAAPLGDYLQIRAGWSWCPEVTATATGRVNMDFPWDIHEDVTVKAAHRTNGPSLMLDWFPDAENGFHLSAGIMANNGRKTIRAFTPDPLPIDEDDRASSGFVVGDRMVTTDHEGRAEGCVDINRVKPYLGMGFGRQCSLDGRVSFCFDMGAVYIGRPRVYSYDWTGTEPVEVDVTSADVNNLDATFFSFTKTGLIDIARKVRVLPTVRMTLTVRLF